MLAVGRVLSNGSTGPSEPTTARQANGIFSEHLRQRVGELPVNFRNFCLLGHALPRRRKTPIIPIRLAALLCTDYNRLLRRRFACLFIYHISQRPFKAVMDLN